MVGKVDPGHTATFERDVANTGDRAVDVQIQLSCPCEPHLTGTPSTFMLAPGESRTLTMALDVPIDAERGVHDVRVKVIERMPSTTGGTGQSAIDIVASYQVRTVGLYADPAIDPQNITARIVNAFTKGVDIEVTGTIATDPPCGIDPITFHVPRSESGSRVTRFHVGVPLQGSDPDGVYALHLQAWWHNQSAGIAPGSRTLEVPIGWGVPSPGTEPEGTKPDLGRGGDDGTATGQTGADGGADGTATGQTGADGGADGDADASRFHVSGTWLVVGAALAGGVIAGGVIAGVWLGRRRG